MQPSNTKTDSLGLNQATPRTMHIDLNSCFATIEQQANRRWRGRPVAVTAYDHPNGFILAASYEAKAMGIKLGLRVKDALALCPDIYIVETDPPKYREAHRRFRDVLLQFTSEIIPKSIDEFVCDMNGSLAVNGGKTMIEIGHEVKQAVYDQVGEAVRCNVGIGPNRFLAKLAAGLHKPDGLDEISADNLEATYSMLRLEDLPGINRRYGTRLKLAGIYSPNEFLNAPRELLRGAVFHGVTGHYWWLRLRGWEIDAEPTKRSSIGHQYAIPRQERAPEKVLAILAKLSEKTGRRLREKNLVAHQLHVGLAFDDHTYWGHGMASPHALHASADIYALAKRILALAPTGTPKRIDVGVHNFAPADPAQLSFFDGERSLRRGRELSAAMDTVNDRFGEFTVTAASMMGTGSSAKDAIAFGKLDDI